MLRNNFFNFLYLAILFTSIPSFAHCIYNRYGHELCVGDTVIETTYGRTNLRPVLITSIDYNMIEIRHRNDSKVKIAPENLIGKRDCSLTDSVFCKRHRVEAKAECNDISGNYTTKEYYYEDYVLVESKTLFNLRQAITKSECLVIKNR